MNLNMIRIMKLNPEKFFRTVDQSMGQVLLHLADGSQYDLKQNCTIRQLLQSVTPGREGLTISLANSADLPAFLSYLISA